MYKKLLLLDNEIYDKERLLKKSQSYTIEKNVIETIKMLDDENN